MTNRYAYATAILGLLIAGSASADKAAALTDTATFQSAYSLSYFGFDLCGDPKNGALYRKALTEKVEYCPFTIAAKARFKQWSAAADPKGVADVNRYIAEHDRLPESLDQKKMNCRKERESPAYAQTIALLAQYASGAAKFDAVVPDPCDTKAGTH
jgi:hypothetical protein